MSLLLTLYLSQSPPPIQRLAIKIGILFISSSTVLRFLTFIKRTRKSTRRAVLMEYYRWWHCRHRQRRYWAETFVVCAPEVIPSYHEHKPQSPWVLALENPHSHHNNAVGFHFWTNSMSNCLWGKITQPTQTSALGTDTQAPFGEIWQTGFPSTEAHCYHICQQRSAVKGSLHSISVDTWGEQGPENRRGLWCCHSSFTHPCVN